MENAKPFIHLIKTPYAHYMFDVNTNNIYAIEEDVHDALFKIQNNTFESIEEIDEITKNKIKILMKEGLLSSKRPKAIKHHLSDKLEYRLKNSLKKLTLQITQECNFRCSYCIYSNGQGLQRNHANKVMSLDTMKKSIDFLISHSRDSESLSIGFYGGEPLLEFELIKKAVLYAEKVAEGKEFSFTITTNGSLLDNEKIEFFIEHNVSIMISLDGPAEIQDKNRRFAENGCGTFKVIEKNLLRIKDKYPEFYKELGFSVVIDPQNDFNCINNLFMNNETFNTLRVRPSLVDYIYSNKEISMTEDYIVKKNYELFKAYLSLLNKIDEKYVSPIATYQLRSIFNTSNQLGGLTQVPDITSHSGPCVPGELRLFVNTEGYFYPCERVSELSDVMRIGHLDDGFYIENAYKLLNIGSLTESSCKNCWAINLCVLCARNADNHKELSGDLKKSYCNISIAQAEEKLLNYIFLSEVKRIFNNHNENFKNGVEISE